MVPTKNGDCFQQKKTEMRTGKYIASLRYVYTLRLIGPISYVGAMLYIHEGNKMHLWEDDDVLFKWTIKSHSPGYEIGPINRSV